MSSILKRSFARVLAILLTASFLLAPAAQAGTTITYLHNDLAGSPVAATNESGAVVWCESYRPYGERVRVEAAAADNRQFFHGKAVDADTGLSYFGARYYDPAVGRFMATDPQRFDEANIHSFNRYAYGNNNPYRFVDPDGNSPIDALFLAADVIKLGVAAYTGVGVGAAAVDVAISTAALFSPVPGAGEAFKLGRAAEHAAEAVRAAGTGAEVAAKVTASELRAAGRADFGASRAAALAENVYRLE
jgi:RHS repeat-associated protein